MVHVIFFSLYFLNASCVGTRMPFQQNDGSVIKKNARLKKIKISSHVVAVVTLETKRHLRQLMETKHKPCVTYELKAWISNPAGQFMPLIYRFPWTRYPRRQVQRELWGTIFIGIDKSRVSCYNGNTDRAAWALFVKHQRAHAKWCRQTHESLGFWLHHLLGFWLYHSPWALGCFTNNAQAATVIIPWIKDILSVSLSLFSSQVMLLRWVQNASHLFRYPMV